MNRQVRYVEKIDFDEKRGFQSIIRKKNVLLGRLIITIGLFQLLFIIGDKI